MMTSGCRQYAALGRDMVRKPSSVGTAIPDAWRRIAEQKKTMLGWPEWSVVAAWPSALNVWTPDADPHTAAAGMTDAIVQLADEDGGDLEGVRLRLKSRLFRRNADVTATLEVLRGSRFVTIARVDAWPGDPHMNTQRVRNISGLKHLAALIQGSHVHRFSDNAKYGIDGFGPGLDGNLPVAVGIPYKLASFRDFLHVVSEEFNISGLEEIQAPQSWQVIL
jgi:hypothetical protein